MMYRSLVIMPALIFGLSGVRWTPSVGPPGPLV
jgi:hypothetical protein